MKKNILRLIAGAVSAALAMMCLTGCEGVVTERQLKSMTEKALEEKYGEEFKCIAVLDRNPNDSYNCVCYPVKNEKLKFEARIYKEGKLGGDYYPKSIASAELSEAFDIALGNVLGRHFTYAYTSLGPDDNETTEKIANKDFSLEFYLSHYREVYESKGNSYDMYFTICIDTSDLFISYEEEWNAITNAFAKVHELGLKYGSNIGFSLNIYFTPPEIYKECEGYLSRNAELRSGFKAMIEGYPQEYNRRVHFGADILKNRISPTKEEYVELRKEID